MHDLNLAAAFCDELIFLKSGSVHVAGPKPLVLTPENIRGRIRSGGQGGLRRFLGLAPGVLQKGGGKWLNTSSPHLLSPCC